MNYKNPLTKHELYLLEPRLAKMLLLIDAYYPDQTITQILRTNKEQDAIYLNHPDIEIRERYKANPWKSVHQLGQNERGEHQVRGADIRYSDQARAIEIMINQIFKYDPERPEKKCAIIHDSGQGLHLHLQSHPNTRTI